MDGDFFSPSSRLSVTWPDYAPGSPLVSGFLRAPGGFGGGGGGGSHFEVNPVCRPWQRYGQAQCRLST